MALSEIKLLHSYLRLHHVFPEDLHIARPLIKMLQKTERITEARSLALSIARNMLANGKAGFALGFLAICKQLNHPNVDEIEALSDMARITDAGTAESESGSEKLFALIDQLSDSEALDFIAQANLIKVKPGEDIVTQGEASETFYLILYGNVDVRLILPDGDPTTLKTLNPGDFFGEFACVYKLKRSATVTASSPTMLLEFSGESISQLIESFPLAGDYLIRTVQTRMVHAATHTIPAFSALPEEDKLWTAEESVVNEYESGDLISVSDRSAPACQIILSGEAELKTADGQGLLLSTGDMFGSASPLIELPLDAEIKATEHALVCEMPEKIFHTFMNLYASFEHHVKLAGENREGASH
ncbi:Cyclic nucleotide-binding domain-containing protein [Mariprofundus aestuarium]|uniref:Cyclic nucleotide-binding domain-containing protein n=1 Tax=Mariprofundus aestuarium TaxID=1921086 RepID=A0A2K8L1W8_MARES|nr:cyclic nucleotide-binding domain-containing protein [Mariprofundus aestuarium]ATX79831.1 Cyclic nucleotide-binding domain-containing protein [Mariprofundus aestuarium]